MLAELVTNTIIQMLLLSLAAGVFLGGALVGTSVVVVRRRTIPAHSWVTATSTAAWIAAAALATLVVYIGTTTTHAVSSN